MKVFSILLVLILCFIPLVFATARGDDQTIEQITKCESYSGQQVSVTDTNTTVTFTTDTNAIYIENLGANEVFFAPDDGVAVADTSHGKLEPGDNRSLSNYATTKIGFISSAAETSTILLEVCS